MTRYEFDRITKRNALIGIIAMFPLAIIHPALSFFSLLFAIFSFLSKQGNKPVEKLGDSKPLEKLKKSPSFKEKLNDIWNKVPFNISFKYEDSNGKQTSRKIQLHRIAQNENNDLYLVGYCYEKKELRSFKYDRIIGEIKYLTNKSNDISELALIAEHNNAFYKKISPIETAFSIDDKNININVDHYDYIDDHIIGIGDKYSTYYFDDITSDIAHNGKSYTKDDFILFLKKS